MKILVINAGSSSLKYQLMDMENESIVANGICERVGIDGLFSYKPKVEGKTVIKDLALNIPTHAEAIQAVLAALVDPENGVLSSMDEITACGHRVLHGGMEFTQSCIVDDACINAIKKCFPLGPLHNPANLMGIEACQAVMPKTPQVAVFDTAFHQSMPEKAYIYAIPYKYFENYEVRRYGFHGTSHRYIAGRAAAMLGLPEDNSKIISCHMGNGSSIAAIKNGKCVDTTMGLTPLSGLPMGTRSGDIDPSILEFIMAREKLSVEEMTNILNKESGVKGISGVSSDFRDIESAMAEGNHRAKLALDIFHYSVAKYIGAYAAAMNGVDGIVFTAGVGENGPSTRSEIASYLGYLGCEINEEANGKRGEEIFISTPGSKTKLMVIPTNEELVIARDTKALIS